jgi:hypothetical protein
MGAKSCTNNNFNTKFWMDATIIFTASQRSGNPRAAASSVLGSSLDRSKE